MDSLLKSDIFFFVSTLCVVLITTVIVILVLRILPLVREAQKLITAFRDEGLDIIRDVRTVRTTIKEQGSIVKSALGGIASFFNVKKKTRKSSKKENA